MKTSLTLAESGRIKTLAKSKAEQNNTKQSWWLSIVNTALGIFSAIELDKWKTPVHNLR